MNVLALDTSTEQGSVALAQDGKLLEMHALPEGWRSATIHIEIARLLGNCRLATRDIDGYGVTSGPGSFTGVRMGLTAVKGLAEVQGKAVVAVSTLETIAAAALLASGAQAPGALAVIMDARRGQIFGALYYVEGGLLKPLIPETVCSLASFLERIAALRTGDSGASAVLGEVTFCGTALASFAPEIEKRGWGGARLLPVSPCLAGPLAQIALHGLRQGLGVEASRVEANYVRMTDAELFWKE